jgi:tetratricopeptide (TPR) repeat protein
MNLNRAVRRSFGWVGSAPWLLILAVVLPRILELVHVWPFNSPPTQAPDHYHFSTPTNLGTGSLSFLSTSPLTGAPDYPLADKFSKQPGGAQDGGRKDGSKSIQFFPQPPLLLGPTTSDPAAVSYDQGVAHFKEGRYREAIEAFKAAVAARPDYAEAYCDMGSAYDALGQYADAVAAYKKALAIRPNYAEAYYNLGLAHFTQNNYGEAIQAFESAVAAKPDYAKAYCKLGAAHAARGERDLAITVYRKAADLEPNGDVGRRAKSAIESLSP